MLQQYHTSPKYTNPGRKLSFDEFVIALKLVAAHRYSSNTPQEQFASITAHVTQSESKPIAYGTLASNDTTTARLTDTSKYTGTHKERFNADGSGKGLGGRDTGVDQITLSTIANRKEADVRYVSFNLVE